MNSLLIKNTTREEREEIVRRALWGGCGAECEFCSGCDNRGDGRIDSLYQPYIDREKGIAEISAALSSFTTNTRLQSAPASSSRGLMVSPRPSSAV